MPWALKCLRRRCWGKRADFAAGNRDTWNRELR
jgi:hypothetical protein